MREKYSASIQQLVESYYRNFAAPTNHVKNSSFEIFSSSPPTDWTQNGGSSSGEYNYVVSGSWCLLLESTAGADGILYQDISSVLGIEYWKGKTVTFGGWCRISNVTCYIIMTDGINTIQLPFYANAMRKKEAHFTVSASATYLQIQCLVPIGSGNYGYFDNMYAYEGAAPDTPWDNYTQLLLNGNFATWTGGGAAAPDNWTLETGSIARESEIIKQPTYSVKLYGDSAYLVQMLTGTPGDIYSLGGWFKNDGIANVGIYLFDYVNSSSSWNQMPATWKYDTKWHWFSVSLAVSEGYTDLAAYLFVDGAGGIGYFADMILVKKDALYLDEYSFTQGHDILDTGKYSIDDLGSGLSIDVSSHTIVCDRCGFAYDKDDLKKQKSEVSGKSLRLCKKCLDKKAKVRKI